jgi:hypothetical protein
MFLQPITLEHFDVVDYYLINLFYIHRRTIVKILRENPEDHIKSEGEKRIICIGSELSERKEIPLTSPKEDYKK